MTLSAARLARAAPPTVREREAADLAEYLELMREVPLDPQRHELRVARYGRRSLPNTKEAEESGPVLRDPAGVIVGRGQTWGGNRKDPEAAIRHLSVEERRAYELWYRDGLVYQGTGQGTARPFDTRHMLSICGCGFARAIFSMTRDGRIYAADQTAEYLRGDRATPRWMFHHSSFVPGEKLAAAGEIEVHDGRLRGITNISGHYRTTATMGRQVLLRLSDAGVDLTGAYYWMARPRPPLRSDRARNVVCPAAAVLDEETELTRTRTLLDRMARRIREVPAFAVEAAQVALTARSQVRAAEYLARAWVRLGDAPSLAPGREAVAARLRALYRDAVRQGDAALREVERVKAVEPLDKNLVYALHLSAHQAYRAAATIDRLEGLEVPGRGYARGRFRASHLERFDAAAKDRLLF